MGGGKRDGIAADMFQGECPQGAQRELHGGRIGGGEEQGKGICRESGWLPIGLTRV